MGLPGCLFSCDVVHIAWDIMCPAQLRSAFAGKEGYPSVAFQVSVTHSKRIIAVMNGEPGARNDKKAIVRFDAFGVNAIKDGELLADVVFELRY